VVYVSSNPYVSSFRPVSGFLGKDHFHTVYDVWNDSWDGEKGTVLPASVTRAAMRALREHPGKRLIVHYLQPHAPYLTLDMTSPGFPVPDPATGNVLKGVREDGNAGLRSLLFRILFPILRKVRMLGSNPSWRVREMLRMEPASPMDAVRRAFGDKGLREAYRGNLAMVTAEAAVLIKFLKGRIAVTADHGEFLGEGGNYSHWVGSSERLLREIPWLLIDKKDAQPLPGDSEQEAEDGGLTDQDEAAIRARLRALGYMD
jgi:hypothetical protein